jgi:hypothetical protein
MLLSQLIRFLLLRIFFGICHFADNIFIDIYRYFHFHFIAATASSFLFFDSFLFDTPTLRLRRFSPFSIFLFPSFSFDISLIFLQRFRFDDAFTLRFGHFAILPLSPCFHADAAPLKVFFHASCHFAIDFLRHYY